MPLSPQMPSVVPYCLRIDFFDWYLSPTHIWPLFSSLPGTPPFQIIHTLPFSNLHTYVYAASSSSDSFVRALYDQAPIFRQVMIQLSLLNAFPYDSKKQVNASSLFSYFLSLSMALLLFSFILWLWSLEDRVNVGFVCIAPSHGAHHGVFYKQANEFIERHKYR